MENPIINSTLVQHPTPAPGRGSGSFRGTPYQGGEEEYSYQAPHIQGNMIPMSTNVGRLSSGHPRPPGFETRGHQTDRQANDMQYMHVMGHGRIQSVIATPAANTSHGSANLERFATAAARFEELDRSELSETVEESTVYTHPQELHLPLPPPAIYFSPEVLIRDGPKTDAFS